jgi:hypothetical protein
MNMNDIADYSTALGRVEVIALDELWGSLGKIDVIKIDLEGIEPDGLRGSVELISKEDLIFCIGQHENDLVCESNETGCLGWIAIN